MPSKTAKTLKICAIGSTFPLNKDDAQVPWLRESLKRLKARGHDVSVFAPAYKGNPDHDIEGIFVKRFRYAPAALETLTHGSGAPNKVHSLSKKLWVISYIVLGGIQAALWARRERFDIIHAHWPFPHGFLSMCMRLACGAPVILNCHGAELALARNSGLIRKALSKILRSHALLCCNSSHTQAQIKRISGRDALISPYGSSIALMPTPETPPPFHQPVRLLFCGRLIERKGIGYLIDALPLLLKTHAVQLDITGEGDCKAQWQARAQELGLGETVRFHGFVDDATLANLYQNCDIYVHPAIHDSRGDTEGLGVVLIEALANAKAVVASEVGGIVDVIKNKQTGLLVPEKDPQALANAIDSLIKDPHNAHNLGKQGQAFINDFFNWDTIIDKTERLYDLATHFCKGRKLKRRRTLPEPPAS